MIMSNEKEVKEVKKEKEAKKKITLDGKPMSREELMEFYKNLKEK